jgi:hypothetical protein
MIAEGIVALPAFRGMEHFVNYIIALVRVEVKVGLFGNAKQKRDAGVRRLDKKKGCGSHPGQIAKNMLKQTAKSLT